MKSILQITLCLVLTNAAFAQRSGMGFGGGGGRPPAGGMGRPAIIPGNPIRYENFFDRGTTRGFYYSNGFGYHDGYGSRGYGYGYANPWAFGSWGVGSWGLGYTSPAFYSSPANNSSPNVTVIYPPPAEPAPIYVERPVPVRHEYDATGQEIKPGAPANAVVVAGANAGANENASPVYLIAFKDKVIRAALSYRVEGNGLHYVTVDREQKRAALDTIDRAFTLQLNRERRVPIQLPE